MNVISFDIEEWYINQQLRGPSEKYVECDRFLDDILNKLDECSIKATFFCVGEMSKSFPKVIKSIHQRGHEIGCHSNIHSWLNKMTKAECREDTHHAVDNLEQCIGEKVKSYRAPAFSIGDNNKWVFEILAENGIERDSSVFPASREFGGFVSYPSETPGIIKYNGISIKEFPICTTKILGKNLAYAGGGYFRFFPLKFVKNKLNASDYSIVYFHIADVARVFDKIMTKEEYENYFKENGTYFNRLKRYLKQNLGISGAYDKMCKLISECDFVNLSGADEMINWERIRPIEL